MPDKLERDDWAKKTILREEETSPKLNEGALGLYSATVQMPYSLGEPVDAQMTFTDL